MDGSFLVGVSSRLPSGAICAKTMVRFKTAGIWGTGQVEMQPYPIAINTTGTAPLGSPLPGKQRDGSAEVL